MRYGLYIIIVYSLLSVYYHVCFSFNPATAECYFIKETNAGIAFKNLRNTIVSGFTAYVFFNPDVGDSSYRCEFTSSTFMMTLNAAVSSKHLLDNLT